MKQLLDHSMQVYSKSLEAVREETYEVSCWTTLCKSKVKVVLMD